MCWAMGVALYSDRKARFLMLRHWQHKEPVFRRGLKKQSLFRDAAMGRSVCVVCPWLCELKLTEGGG
jgi:hypothetical protein